MSDEPNRFIVVRMVAVLDDAIPENGEPDVSEDEINDALREIAARLKVELPGVFVDVMAEYEMFEQLFPCPALIHGSECGQATTLVEGFHRPKYRQCEAGHESSVSAEVLHNRRNAANERMARSYGPQPIGLRIEIARDGGYRLPFSEQYDRPFAAEVTA